jgi:small subunit ribosomal protein S1
MTEEPSNKDGGEEESFADLFESYSDATSEDLRVGDKVKGKIISVGRDAVFVDTGTKIDGVVDKEELLDQDRLFPYEEGDLLELYVVSVDENEIALSRALSGRGSPVVMQEAFENSIPVEGKVKEQCKGGFVVDIMKKRAFCPINHIDVRFVEKPDGYVGEVYQFLITRYEENGRNIVVSRRELINRELEEARGKFFDQMKVGVELEGTVARVMPYGVFVELFPGVEGMVHSSELTWSRAEKPGDIVKVGDSIRVKVIGIEQGGQGEQVRIALSVKQLESDPWESVASTFREGDKVKGRVTRCRDFGAFVEIAPGIEGLVHISEMSYYKRVLKPQEVVKDGDIVEVMVKEIDPERKRISLSIRDAEGDPWIDVEEKYKVGQTHHGTVEKKEKFGHFIRLEPGITGLLPRSKFKDAASPALIEKRREGETIAVVIEEIDPLKRTITLGPGDSKEESEWQNFTQDASRPLGILGEKLQRALTSKKRK